jgi:glycerol uptake facilitator-like aquaporin
LTYTLSNNGELARAIAYFILFVLFYHVTGAHFNPATSLADFLFNQTSGKYPQLIDRKNALKLLLVTFLI